MYYLRKELLETQWKYYCDNPFVYYKEVPITLQDINAADTLEEAFEKYITLMETNCIYSPWEVHKWEENIRWAEEELKKLKENKNEERRK